MKPTLALAALLVPLSFASAARAEPVQLLVDLVDSTTDQDEAELEAKLGGLDIRLNSIHAADERLFIVDVDSLDVDRLLNVLKDDPRVEVAEPNFVYSLPEPNQDLQPDGAPARRDSDEPFVPNDPMWEAQWSFRMVGAPEAWRKADGRGAIVAVIDTGVAFEDYKKFKRVEDLAETEFVTGYDFIHDTDHPNDDHGHGTHVAGTIAQSTNNGIGVAGLAPRARIMPLKVLSARGGGTAGDIADAIRFAADEGANVINMSLGGGMRSRIMENAVAYARKKGVVVVCAAGNSGRPKVEFPAAYKGAFAVSSVGPTKQLAYYSSHGAELAVAAPGGDKSQGESGGILQNTIAPGRVADTNLYLSFQGTSMAAPHVAGIAALVYGAGVTDAGAIEKILRETAEQPEGKGWNLRYGDGIVNAARAVEAAKSRTSGPIHLGAALLALAGLLWRKKKLLPFTPGGIGALLGAIVGSSGFFFLNGLGASAGVELLSTGMPSWDTALLGASWHFTAIWASALPVVVLTVALLGVRRMRGFLVGLALGWAAHLLVSAACLGADVQWVPGVASVLDRVWLVLNAGVLALLATVVTKVSGKK